MNKMCFMYFYSGWCVTPSRFHGINVWCWWHDVYGITHQDTPSSIQAISNVNCQCRREVMAMIMEDKWT